MIEISALIGILAVHVATKAAAQNRSLKYIAGRSSGLITGTTWLSGAHAGGLVVA